MRTRTVAAFTIASAGLLGLTILAGAGVQRSQPDSSTSTRQSQQGGPNIGQMLIDGLNESEGCLKVVTAQTSAGTNTIIAWFENKAAVEAWYYSPIHERMVGMVGGDVEDKKPMAHVKDADAPVMVMASITMGGETVIPGPMPVSQISIELYTPLDAGASVNGRLMPEEIKLKHFNAIDTAVGG